MPKTRQQRRARSRAPLKRKRRGSTAFLVFLMALLLGGGGLIAVFRLNPPPLTRGAIAGEHWHASIKMYICGKQVTNYPTVEGELHSHGDGFIHIHPQTMTNELASLGTYLRTYETILTEDAKGKRTLTFPGNQSYADGDTCPKSKKKERLVVTNKGEPIEGDPGAFIPHEGDAVEIVFGKKGKDTMPNPYSKAKGIPDAGVSTSDEPAPDAAATPPALPELPTPNPEPEDEASPEPTAE